MSDSDIRFLSDLESIIRRRIEERPDGSYTASLIASGDKRVAQKVGEEALELALALVDGNEAELLDEAADLVFHLQVLLASRNLRLADVSEKLAERHAAQS